MYGRLLENLPLTTPIYHWGDVDEGGFRIASTIAAVARGAGLQPLWDVTKDVPLNMRVKSFDTDVGAHSPLRVRQDGPELGQAMREAGFVAEQEALERGYMADVKGSFYFGPKLR